MTRPADEDACGAAGPEAGEPEVLVLADPVAVARAAATRLVAAVAAAVDRRGRADVASTGGSAPAGIYAALAAAPLAGRMPWEGLHVWLGDDRFVPRTDPRSNMAPIDRDLLGGNGRPTPLPTRNVHPWPTDAALAAASGPLAGPGACAAAHEAEMRAGLPTDAQGWPVFDVVLVGVGTDGHVLSLFPGSPAVDAPGWTAWAAAPTHIEPQVARVTCTPPILLATPCVIVTATGASKAAMIAHLLRTDRDVHALPAQLARRAAATWILDAEAAAILR